MNPALTIGVIAGSCNKKFSSCRIIENPAIIGGVVAGCGYKRFYSI
ncbi:MAG TPA: hypothetical protein VJZ02_06320 [Candidatus Brocadiales bacterium]|nr:hypothetical protein [Candidatus Brocadiales bacterium]